MTISQALNVAIRACQSQLSSEFALAKDDRETLEETVKLLNSLAAVWPHLDFSSVEVDLLWILAQKEPRKILARLFR